ncbi:MAG: hypothetical protein ABSA49_08100 [Rhizomicrobium sp.]|jgi:hypothetical protein
MNALRAAFALAVSLLVTACLPVTSSTPVGSTVGFAADPALSGLWRGQVHQPEGWVYMTFFPQTDGTTTALLISPPDPSRKDSSAQGDWSVYSLQTATLGPYRYMNAQEVSNNGKAPDEAQAGKTFPLLYRVNSDGALVIYLLDEKAAAVAIKSGAIAGAIGQGQFADITITAAPADLDAFMTTPAGRALFVKPLILLKKVK